MFNVKDQRVNTIAELRKMETGIRSAGGRKFRGAGKTVTSDGVCTCTLQSGEHRRDRNCWPQEVPTGREIHLAPIARRYPRLQRAMYVSQG